ncbi:MAG: fibronectin type III domain-containing protein [Candidatus Eisenbacteria bacterium]
MPILSETGIALAQPGSGTPAPAAPSSSGTAAVAPVEPAPGTPVPPVVQSVRAADTPSDDGTSLTVTWVEPPNAAELGLTYEILRADRVDGEYAQVGDTEAGTTEFKNLGLTDRQTYFYKVRSMLGAGYADSEPTQPAAPEGNWFRSYRLNVLILVVVFSTLVLSYISIARKGKQIYIRRIAGLNAVDEAVGRATEMGKKILYIPGIMSVDEIQTIASLAILGHVAKLSATYNADLEVPNKDPLTFAAARETVREAYVEAGRPDLYREEMVNYVTYDQFAYTASVTGKMVREKPATNFLIGSFYAESLLLAETGQSIGAIQISGTAEVAQLPFFVVACDYTLIGEELYAASAYLSREPVLLGSIKGQDVTKLLLILALGLGIIMESFGLGFVKTAFKMQ